MPYWKITYTVEVLTDGETRPYFNTLQDIHEAITHGGASGTVSDSGAEELDRNEIIEALAEQGSDPAFLVQDYELCEECEEPECPGLIECPQCHIENHGASAFTHIADHGYCDTCLGEWKDGIVCVECDKRFNHEENPGQVICKSCQDEIIERKRKERGE